jgi:hypothetical protein
LCKQLLLDKGAMAAYGVWKRRHGVKGTCAFAELEYFDLCVDIILDIMHIEKNNGNQLMGMLAGLDTGRKHELAIAEIGVYKSMKSVSVFNVYLCYYRCLHLTHQVPPYRILCRAYLQCGFIKPSIANRAGWKGIPYGVSFERLPARWRVVTLFHANVGAL